tara:strand:+ start:599 stop:1018 length:420 start_codon:yes stop_codon:yes gene_type:complete
MTFWRKTTDAQEFIEISLIAIGNQKENKCLEDKMVYTSYNSPMTFLRYRKKILGLKSLLEKWTNDVEEDINEPKQHWRRVDFDFNTEEGKLAWKEFYLIEKMNNFLSAHLRWHNGMNSKQQFNHAKDIYYYFKKEESYQ